MVKIKVFAVNSQSSCHPDLEERTLAPMEAFIAQIGYDSIKNIVTLSTSGAGTSFYTIFYEDGQPYTPYVEADTSKRKGLFG